MLQTFVDARKLESLVELGIGQRIQQSMVETLVKIYFIGYLVCSGSILTLCVVALDC